MRLLVALLSLVLVSGVAVPAVAATGSGAAPAYLEGHAADPVTAAPPVSRPKTKHCTVSLADAFPSNAADGTPQNYSGTLTPPANCPGPWSKVVLDSTTTVSGRQYDRSGSLQVGGVTIWFGTTQEPDGATPTTFSFSKDVTRYSALFRSAQPYSGGIGNYTSDVYTGVYSQTVSLTFYDATRRYPAPAEPNDVVAVPVPDLNPGTPTQDVTVGDLPRNITRADLEVTLKGNGCDEQWFTAVPDQVAADFPGDGLCASGPYREASFSVDGTPAGALGTFPHIYSGGIVPTLWRPVLAIDTLDLRPENLDLTPFAGTLTDGGSHTIGVTISPIGDTWNVAATLFLWTDPHRAHTTGALTTDTVPAAPTTRTTTAPIKGGDRYRETASRRDVISGYVNTSSGRVTTTDTYRRAFANAGQVTDSGLVQSVRQTDRVRQTSVSRIGRRVVRSSTLRESYPITVDFSAAQYVDDQNFALTGAVRMAQVVHSVERGTGRPVRRHWRWVVDSHGSEARSDGVTSETDGRSRTTYVGTNDVGRPYHRRIVTKHGQIVSNTGS